MLLFKLPYVILTPFTPHFLIHTTEFNGEFPLERFWYIILLVCKDFNCQSPDRKDKGNRALILTILHGTVLGKQPFMFTISFSYDIMKIANGLSTLPGCKKE